MQSTIKLASWLTFQVDQVEKPWIIKPIFQTGISCISVVKLTLKCHLSCSLYPYTAKVDLNQVHTPRFPMVGKYGFVTIAARTLRFESMKPLEAYIFMTGDSYSCNHAEWVMSCVTFHGNSSVDCNSKYTNWNNSLVLRPSLRVTIKWVSLIAKYQCLMVPTRLLVSCCSSGLRSIESLLYLILNPALLCLLLRSFSGKNHLRITLTICQICIQIQNNDVSWGTLQIDTSNYNLSLTYVWPSSSRPFLARWAPNPVGRKLGRNPIGKALVD